MADAEALTFAFMRAHPAEAAQALQVVPADAAAALLARAPTRLASPVLRAMEPGAAAAALAGLGDERAMELLGTLGARSAVALLRRIGEPRRSRLIAGLPTAAALASRLLLGYPEDTVGSWADPDVIALPPDARTGDALERVRRAESNVEHLFVVASLRLVGWLPLSALLRAPEGAALHSLMERPDVVLPAQTPLAGALAHPGWRRRSALPVVESGGRLLGVLTHDALARALRGVPATGGSSVEETLLGVLARGYWGALSGVVEAAATLLPPVRSSSGRDDER